MGISLRPYQVEAVARVVDHFRTSTQAACLVLPTGAGKSVVIAELCRRARGRVLVLAHVKELCLQNYDKYMALCRDDAEARTAGLYAAGLERRDTEHQVLFGSVQSVARHLDELERPGEMATRFSLVIIDECHRYFDDDGAQYKKIVQRLRERNPKLKVLGMTATPYRLGLGWIYRVHDRGFVRSSESRPFERCVYEVSLKALMDAGHLTPAVVEDAAVTHYDFESVGRSTTEGDGGIRAGTREDEVSDLVARSPRVTRAIVDEVVSIAQTQGRRGVMIFCASVQHAREVLGYLPDGRAALVLGETPPEERDRLVREFSEQKLRYLVNVAVLTTGFDAPHVDFIAILRRTESVALFQQMVGRGLRLAPGKSSCLVVDYAQNGFDLFSPEVVERKPSADSVVVAVECPTCAFSNSFWGKVDEEGRAVEHFGRRCHGPVETPGGKIERCSYRFRFKECDACGAENDIAARTCEGCERTLVDPDDMLRDALRMKKSLVLRVSGMTLDVEGTKLRVTYHDEDGAKVSEWFDFHHAGQRRVFARIFGRRIAQGRRPLELESPEQARLLQPHLPMPDFVVALEKKGKGRARYFQVKTRLFDYSGRFRRASTSWETTASSEPDVLSHSTRASKVS